MKQYIIDIETNGLENPDTIWCVVIESIESGTVWDFYVKEHLKRWLKGFCSKCQLIGHNIIDFDIPWLRKIWDIDIPNEQLLDTLILSRMYDPKRPRHSLESWGEELGYPKTEFSDFSNYSKEMLEYCKNDVKVNKQLYLYLKNKVTAPLAIEIEHSIQPMLSDARKYGFYFDTSRAIDLLQELEKERSIYDELIEKAYPPVEVGKRVKKLVYFNPDSPKQCIDKLWEANWEPSEPTIGYLKFPNNYQTYYEENKHKIGTWREPTKEFYEKEKAKFERYGWKINENNLATLPKDAPESVKCILKRTILETRIRKLNEWLALVECDGGIHGNIISVGTWTHRMVHRNPNMANISAKKSIKYHTPELNTLATELGGRMRALWRARPGRVLVGTDAEGIQLRVLAHYLEDPEFIKSVTEGNKHDGTDPHSLNQKRIGIGTRDNAKTFIYAFLLGAGDGKIAEIYNIIRRKATDLKESFITSTPGLKRIKTERIPFEAKRGYTIGFDGRRIYCNSEHLMMAAYLQAGEAIIMKLATVLAVKEIKRRKLDAHLINVVHDEMLFDCAWRHAERVRKITEEAIKKAGEILKLKCPMKGEGFIGRTWLEVH